MPPPRDRPARPGRLARERADAELERLLGPYATPAQSIEADPPGHGGEPAAQVLDTPAAGAGKAQPRLLPGVIRVRMRAEHAERDRVEIGAMGLELGGELLFSHGPPPRGGEVTPGPRYLPPRPHVVVPYCNPRSAPWRNDGIAHSERGPARCYDGRPAPVQGRVRRGRAAADTGASPPAREPGQRLQRLRRRRRQERHEGRVSPEKLLTVAVWYENPLFDDAERAALALAEAATRLSDRPGAVTDEIWAEAARHYDERQLAALVLMVAITNFFNRLNTTLRVPAGTAWD